MFLFQNSTLDGYSLWQRDEAMFSLWQKEIMLPTNTSYIVDGIRSVNSLGFNRHLLCNAEDRSNGLQGGLRDQDLAAYGIGLDAGCEVNMRPQHSVLGAPVRADIAYHHFTRVHPNAHFHFRQPVLSILGIDRGHSQLHRHGTGYCPLCVVRPP